MCSTFYNALWPFFIEIAFLKTWGDYVTPSLFYVVLVLEILGSSGLEFFLLHILSIGSPVQDLSPTLLKIEMESCFEMTVFADLTYF